MTISAVRQTAAMDAQRAKWDALMGEVDDPRIRMAMAARVLDELECRVAEQTEILAECIDAVERSEKP